MDEKSKKIGVLSIFVNNRKESAMKINEIFFEHGGIIIGRMGIPCDPEGFHVIAVVLNGTEGEINALALKIASLPDVKAELVFPRE